MPTTHHQRQQSSSKHSHFLGYQSTFQLRSRFPVVAHAPHLSWFQQSYEGCNEYEACRARSYCRAAVRSVRWADFYWSNAMCGGVEVCEGRRLL